MGKGWLGAAACLAIAVAAAADAWGEPLRFRWPLPAEAVVTQATIDHFGNFAHEYRIRASRPAGGGAIRVSTSGYRLLYHNRRLLTGRKLDGFDMLGILHRLTVPSYVIDGAGRLQRIEPPDRAARGLHRCGVGMWPSGLATFSKSASAPRNTGTRKSRIGSIGSANGGLCLAPSQWTCRNDTFSIWQGCRSRVGPT